MEGCNWCKVTSRKYATGVVLQHPKRIGGNCLKCHVKERFFCKWQSPKLRVGFMDTGFETFPLTRTETLKWLSSLPTLMQKSFRWRQCSDRCIISTYIPIPLFSPSLLSLVVSVDVKHHVYLLTYARGGR